MRPSALGTDLAGCCAANPFVIRGCGAIPFVFSRKLTKTRVHFAFLRAQYLRHYTLFFLYGVKLPMVREMTFCQRLAKFDNDLSSLGRGCSFLIGKGGKSWKNR
jgi:hypothetical protein